MLYMSYHNDVDNKELPGGSVGLNIEDLRLFSYMFIEIAHSSSSFWMLMRHLVHEKQSVKTIIVGARVFAQGEIFHELNVFSKVCMLRYQQCYKHLFRGITTSISFSLLPDSFGNDDIVDVG